MEETLTQQLVIVEDHGLIAETVGVALRSRGFGVALVDALAVEDLVPAITVHGPDLVLLDLELGNDRDALGILPELVADGVTVLMMTGVTDRVRLARCLRAGAVGIVDKGLAFDRLIDAIIETLEQGTLLSRHEREEYLVLLRGHEHAERGRLLPFERLTDREAEVLRALCHGRNVDGIAQEWVVSVNTVRTQVRAILRKLGVGSQLAATALARATGWFDRGA